MMRQGHIRILFMMGLMFSLTVSAQEDTTRRRSIDSIILRQKGIIGQLAHNLLADTGSVDQEKLLRTDKPFQRHAGKVIRTIRVKVFEFEITDSSDKLSNRLKRLSDKLHSQTRDFVIRNNLFFSVNQRLSPFVMGDNERHLRDLPFTRDARIIVVPVRGTRDSVDIVVATKDVLSLGGSFRMHNTQSVSMSIEEENFLGFGDLFGVRSLFDAKRAEKFGYGIDYTKRNVLGTFINASAGYTNFAKTFNSGEREERVAYFTAIRPLVNRFMKWTYGVEMKRHESQNFYNPDSLYDHEFRYRYDIADLWGTWNIDADKVDVNRNAASTRRLISLRVLDQQFKYKPIRYESEYYYSYADIRALLGSISIFQQNFYKTQYIYGFGRYEDVPEGLEASVTMGWTRKNERTRPFTGFDFKRYFFTGKEHYFNYTLRAGAYLFEKKLEDIDLLAQVDFFSRLRELNRSWKQRFFLGASITKQINSVLGEPVRIESEYGLEELRNNNAAGNFRATLKGESVFFSPWSVLFFRMAPFVFAHGTYINLKLQGESVPKLYASIGGGFRIRNESLIFGTTEFKGMYFPRRSFRNESWRVEVSTNIRFKYNQQFIKRPEFVRVN
jgi:hypothetical protein